MNVITFFRILKHHQVMSTVASLQFNGKIERGINANRMRNLILNAYMAYEDDNGQKFAIKRANSHATYILLNDFVLYLLKYLAKVAVTSYYNK